ncbi:MAG: hypothetical protein Q8K34_14465 [Hydrogenophaga sp.]|nr:hypothetical protein [Hydrogenophaga sp.]
MPVISDGRITKFREWIGERQHQFQSTPVISDGRIDGTGGGVSGGGGFNPRPSFLTGES